MDYAPVPEMAVIHQALIFSTRAPPEVPVDYGLPAEAGDGLL
jgi:hypothetical protein